MKLEKVFLLVEQSYLLCKELHNIGNMTSQLLAIYFLNDLDHYIKEKLYCKYYVRYMDDFIIFDYDKERLKVVRKKLKKN